MWVSPSRCGPLREQIAHVVFLGFGSNLRVVLLGQPEGRGGVLIQLKGLFGFGLLENDGDVLEGGLLFGAAVCRDGQCAQVDCSWLCVLFDHFARDVLKGRENLDKKIGFLRGWLQLAPVAVCVLKII